MCIVEPEHKRRKHLILNQTKLTMAKRILGAKTETETIEFALDRVISESEKDRLTDEATERFLRSGIDIHDVFGALEAK